MRMSNSHILVSCNVVGFEVLARVNISTHTTEKMQYTHKHLKDIRNTILVYLQI